MAQKRVLNIFFEGLKIYGLNLHKFLLYMSFPVFGQVLGIFMIFGSIFYVSQNVEQLSSKITMLNEVSGLLIFMLLIAIPGLIIFTKALWDYLVAYGALNSMTEGYLGTGRVYDFKSHVDTVYNKKFAFIALWFLFGLYTLLSFLPIFWIIGGVFFIYFILIFQVFTFENGVSPVGYFRRSFELIRGNFSRTFLLAIILFVFTYYLLPSGVGVLFDAIKVSNPLMKWFELWAYSLPIEPFEPFGVTPLKIAEIMVKQLSFFIAVGMTLPLRSVCWTLWYSNLFVVVPVPQKSQKRKRQSAKNLKNFKIEKREIDPEIIRRARLEDDEY